MLTSLADVCVESEPPPHEPVKGNGRVTVMMLTKHCVTKRGPASRSLFSSVIDRIASEIIPRVSWFKGEQLQMK